MLQNNKDNLRTF